MTIKYLLLFSMQARKLLAGNNHTNCRAS